MSDLASRPTGPTTEHPTVDRPTTKRRQIGLRTLFLLIAVIAIWMTVIVNRQQIRSMELRINAMRPLARDLEVEDTNKIAVVKLNDLWMNEDRWDIHLPAGSYRIRLASREIDDVGLAPLKKEGSIRPGRHRVVLEQRQVGKEWRASVTCDGSELFAIEEPKEFSGSGFWGGGEYSTCKQLPADQPVVLYRCRFVRPIGKGQSSVPDGPTDGLMLWIEPEDGQKTAP